VCRLFISPLPRYTYTQCHGRSSPSSPPARTSHMGSHTGPRTAVLANHGQELSHARLFHSSLISSSSHSHVTLYLGWCDGIKLSNLLLPRKSGMIKSLQLLSSSRALARKTAPAAAPSLWKVAYGVCPSSFATVPVFVPSRKPNTLRQTGDTCSGAAHLWTDAAHLFSTEVLLVAFGQRQLLHHGDILVIVQHL